MSDCVLRQFGYVQVIPSKVLHPIKCFRGPQNKKYVCVHDDNTTPFERWEHHCLKLDKLGAFRANYVTEVVQGYMQYYVARTHLKLIKDEASAPMNVERSQMSNEAVSDVVNIYLKITIVALYTNSLV